MTTPEINAPSHAQESVPVAIEVGLSLGSNLGDRLAALAEARRRILALKGVRFVAASPVYETEPVDVRPEYRHVKFLNAALVVATPLKPERFSRAMHKIEVSMGRQRGPDRNAPRPVDIDIIYFGDRVITSAELHVPHPRWHERRFVARPLADVRPALILPGHPYTVLETLTRLPLSAENLFVESQEW